MPTIRPFRGILYNPQTAADIAGAVSEPYDVISSQQQAAYYKSNPYNIVRLILGRHSVQDDRKNNRYTRAAKLFAQWQKQRVLLRDSQANIYIYTQSFPHKNSRKTRTGFIVLLKLEDFAKNSILPHENTFSQPVQDRLKLLHSTGANLSPIFALFGDAQGKVNKLLNQHKRAHRPYFAIEKDKVVHRIWRMGDKRKIRTIQQLLKQQQIFIADGHHRYEAALNYKMQMQKKKRRPRGTAAFNYVMTYLVASNDPGLTVLPTHRAVRIKSNFKLEEIIKSLSKSFKLHKFSSSAKLFSYMLRQGRSGGVFGTYFGKNRFYGLKMKQTGTHHPLHKLDVPILHSLIIERILPAAPFEESIYYTRDAQEAIKFVDAGKYQIAFFLRPTKVSQVQKVAKAGEKMPHKSTYFYPKALTGLVINKF